VRFGLFAFGYDAEPVSVSARKVRDAAERGGGPGVPIDMTVEVTTDLISVLLPYLLSHHLPRVHTVFI
jgi:hypothetical protein